MCGLAFAVIASWLWFRTSQSQKVRTPSLAVLPLENVSGQSEQEYFADGMTDALFTDLAKLHDLSVISRTSVMQYKKTRKTIPEIARELRVDYVVEGTVMRAGNRVRITAQLIAAPTDRHLWAERYDESDAEVMRVQSTLARAIAQQIRVHITPQENARLSSPRVSNVAHDLYLKGRYNWHTRETERMLKSIDYYEQALQISPDYAQAYVGLAETYAVLSYRLERRDYVQKACAAAKKAVELNETSGDAYASMTTCVDDWEWDKREEYFLKTLGLSPNYAHAHQWYSKDLMIRSRLPEAIAEARRAVELDPLSPSPNNALGTTLYFARQYGAAVQHCQRALELFPGFDAVYYALGFALTEMGRYQEAVTLLERGLAENRGFPPLMTLRAHVRARSGDRGEARHLLAQYKARKPISRRFCSQLFIWIRAITIVHSCGWRKPSKSGRWELTKLRFSQCSTCCTPTRGGPGSCAV